MPTIINGPDVILFSSDKAKFFARNFASNSMLDKYHSLPDFPTLMMHKLCDFSITAQKVSTLIKSLVVVLKNLDPELSLILAKLFNCYMKGKCFQSVLKVPVVHPFFQNAGECSSPFQDHPP